ncbi:chemotaxis protein CheW [Acetonema longum]|uniref:Chemotaxis protein CheW n=1 Tax=Acetonema longum DSM 6540 TaxID=1009370 RepID=F7NL67_9FIRM|nr:chemotaxis protein CheW [Acetonema longum]EGO63172.1 CheW protein [Acetonema longum DSM 6540]
MADKEYSSSEVQLVVFKLGREEYGFNILQVQEIKKMTDITRVPNTPEYVKGVINLRGSVLPVIDLKKRLGLAEGDYSDTSRIIIVKVDEVHVGMVVDAVTEVTAISQDHIEPPYVVSSEVGINYISGVGKLDNRLLILLNVASIVAIGQEAVK